MRTQVCVLFSYQLWRVQLWGRKKKQVNSCALQCFACVLHVYSRADNPRAFCVSNWSHAALACTGESERAGLFDLFLTNERSSWAGRRVCHSQSELEPPADRLGLRVPDTREVEQLLYAGRQRAEAFLSPEKTAHSRFLWITRKVEKLLCTT